TPARASKSSASPSSTQRSATPSWSTRRKRSPSSGPRPTSHPGPRSSRRSSSTSISACETLSPAGTRVAISHARLRSGTWRHTGPSLREQSGAIGVHPRGQVIDRPQDDRPRRAGVHGDGGELVEHAAVHLDLLGPCEFEL